MEQFGPGQSQIGWLPRKPKDASLQHMGNAPDLRFYENWNNWVNGGDTRAGWAKRIGNGLTQGGILNLALGGILPATGAGAAITAGLYGVPTLTNLLLGHRFDEQWGKRFRDFGDTPVANIPSILSRFFSDWEAQ